MDFSLKLDAWIPYVLTQKNKNDRVNVARSHLVRAKKKGDAFLERIVTGDEKWILYDNPVRSRSWRPRGEAPKVRPRAELHPVKVLLCIWWDCQGVVYYELLRQGETINAKKYCEYLEKLAVALCENHHRLVNRDGVIFHHDNAKPHTAKITEEKLSELQWDVLPQPPYSPDIAPSDFYLFRSLQNSLNGKKFIDV